jgi:hypothetical protein
MGAYWWHVVPVSRCAMCGGAGTGSSAETMAEGSRGGETAMTWTRTGPALGMATSPPLVTHRP